MERKRKKKAKKLEEANKAAAAAEAAARKKEATPSSGQKSRKVSGEKTIIRTFAPTPTNKKTFGHFGKLKNPALGASKSRGALSNAHESSMSSIGRKSKNQKQETGLGMNERVDGAIDDTYNATSRFSLYDELPSIDTVDMVSAQRKFKHNAKDVSLTEVLDAEEVMVDGLKTATQTSLVKHYDEAFR
jgi:hypothetical protein